MNREVIRYIYHLLWSTEVVLEAVIDDMTVLGEGWLEQDISFKFSLLDIIFMSSSVEDDW